MDQLFFTLKTSKHHLSVLDIRHQSTNARQFSAAHYLDHTFMHGHFQSFIMGFIETQSSDPLDLTYKSKFQILYSVTFSWLEQQHYQQRFHGFERFPIFHQNERYTGC